MDAPGGIADLSYLGGSRADGAAGERFEWSWCDRAEIGSFMQSIGLLFTEVVISTGDISTAAILTQTFCNAVLPSGGKDGSQLLITADQPVLR